MVGWLIKVGDWVTHAITGERFEITEYNDKYVWLRKENGFRDITTHETLYKWLYLEQKQRADRAEKRWNTLKEDLTECSNDPLYEVHHRVRKDVKQVFVNILKKMCDLEEDGE